MVAGVQAHEVNGDGALSRPVYDVPHMPTPWGWKVSAYLWTKSISAGALLVAAMASFLGVEATGGPLLGVAAPLVALLFLAVTTGLLVFDLKRPDRFHYILLKSNPRSWLVWGAWILMAYGAIALAWLLGGLADQAGLLRVLAVPTALLAGAAAGYSAFLFGQAEGRDFWQSPLLLPQLLVGAIAAGAATLLILGVVFGIDSDGATSGRLASVLGLALVVQAVVLLAELGVAHANLDVARAARLITHGAWRAQFWGGVVAAGTILPLALVWTGSAGAVIAAILALAGLWLYEHLWVKAGQSLPLS
jgi:formate-dependent nitrite reductase membrane component NrfD